MLEELLKTKKDYGGCSSKRYWVTVLSQDWRRVCWKAFAVTLTLLVKKKNLGVLKIDLGLISISVQAKCKYNIDY